MDINKTSNLSFTQKKEDFVWNMISEIEEYAIFMLDIQGNVMTWNRGAEKIKGYTSEEIIGKNFSVFYPEDARQQQIPELVLDQAKKLGKAEHSGWRLRKDGSLFWGNAVITALHNEQQEVIGFTKILRDITKQKKKEEALSKSEKKFRKLLEAAPDAMVIVDREGNIQLTNTQTERLFGYSEAALIGQPVEVLMPEMLRKGHKAFRSNYNRNPKVRMMGEGLELQGQRKDGTLFPVEIALSPIDVEGDQLISAAIRDITEKKKNEKALVDSEKKFRKLLEAAPDAMVIVNQEGNIQLTNTQTEKLFGYSQAALIGQQVEMLMPEVLRKGHETYREKYNQSPKVRMMGEGLELQGQRQDGTLFPVEIALSPIDVEGGQLISAAIRDITEKKKNENQIHVLNENLEQKVKERTTELEKIRNHLEEEIKKRTQEIELRNQELEAFNYSVSHDLRAPLSAISGYSDILKEDYFELLDEEGKRVISIINNNVLKMHQLINE
ncbi:PAS domain S-box protein, partial [Rapidithrix thailandica]